MINLFTPAAQDQSIYYLGQIFGPVGTVLQPTSSSLILGTMFRYFNSVVLSVAALVVLYVTIVGVIKTAHEGEFLGKEWNTPWIPIRMVLGIAALVPSASGYCAMQIITMWIIIQGIGAGDAVWTTVLNYTGVMGSPVSTFSMPDVGVKGNFQSMYKALTCQATARATYSFSSPGDTSKGRYYCAYSTDSFCKMSNDSGGILNIKGPQTKRITQTEGGKTTYLIQYPFGPQGGACGTMSYEDPEKTCADTSSTSNQIACSTAQAQQQALQATVSVLGGIAQQFVSADYSYRGFFDLHNPPPDWVKSFCSANGWNESQCCYSSQAQLSGVPTSEQTYCQITSDLNSGDYNNAASESVTQIYWPYNIQPSVAGNIDFIQASVNNYTTNINNGTASAVQQSAANNTSLNSTLQQAQQLGWIFAGAYYYYLTGQNKGNVSASVPTLIVTGQDPKVSQSNTLYNQRNNFEAAGALLSQSSQSQSSVSMSLSPELQDLSQLSDSLDSVAGSMSNIFMEMLTGAGAGQQAKNPLIALSALGQILIMIAEMIFAAVILLLPLISAGFVTFSGLGNFITNWVGPVISTLGIFFAPLFALLTAGLFTFGALLAIYVPLIPYIIYTMAAVGWLILVIEAMVAAPIVALGILIPSQGHTILGKSSQSLYYLFGIFLRPALMVFGMMAAMLLASVVVTMINAGFAGVMASLSTSGPTAQVTSALQGAPSTVSGGLIPSAGSGSSPGLVGLIIFACIYVALILYALNKSFALIYLIPDRILRWIGGGPETYGAEAAAEAPGAAKEGAVTGAGFAQATGAKIAGEWAGKFGGVKPAEKPEAPETKME